MGSSQQNADFRTLRIKIPKTKAFLYAKAVHSIQHKDNYVALNS
jgi:hypothetical protein